MFNLKTHKRKLHFLHSYKNEKQSNAACLQNTPSGLLGINLSRNLTFSFCHKNSVILKKSFKIVANRGNRIWAAGMTDKHATYPCTKDLLLDNT